MSKPIAQLVWFKRDLRISDHQPLKMAASQGAVLPLFLFEPEFWSQPENSVEHFLFVRQAISELRESLRSIGGDLFVRTGETIEILQAFSDVVEIAKIWSHEETGSMWTYQRDRKVAKWARTHNIPWEEIPSNGVVRRLRSRDGWARIWQSRMDAPTITTPTRLSVPAGIPRGEIPYPKELCKNDLPIDSGPRHLQRGGESEGRLCIEGFLADRGQAYRTSMSSPLPASDACSRISPYIAWGCLSIRTVHHLVQNRQRQLAALQVSTRDQATASWRRSLTSFKSRLSWHCHFIQKLEDEPEIEFQNICRIYDGLREGEFDEDRFEAWKLGRTGYPMIDACMRFLQRERWINFRMRAMLMSFAAYHLWLHWRRPALHLAHLFLDFEPGIHYPQCQMQSGVTGINTIRIYSPTKQAIDQDPEGRFIRQNIPELENVPTIYIHEPWKMGMDDQVRFRCRIGVDYPRPIVEHASAVRYAKQRIFEIRQSEAAIEMARQVYEKHGSRKHRDPIPSRSRKPTRTSQQPFLPGLFEDLDSS